MSFRSLPTHKIPKLLGTRLLPAIHEHKAQWVFITITTFFYVYYLSQHTQGFIWILAKYCNLFFASPHSVIDRIKSITQWSHYMPLNAPILMFDGKPMGVCRQVLWTRFTSTDQTGTRAEVKAYTHSTIQKDECRFCRSSMESWCRLWYQDAFQ